MGNCLFNSDLKLKRINKVLKVKLFNETAMNFRAISQRKFCSVQLFAVPPQVLRGHKVLPQDVRRVRTRFGIVRDHRPHQKRLGGLRKIWREI